MGPCALSCIQLNLGQKTRDDSAVLKTKAVVQPVAINAPIWSNGEYESQF